MVEENFTCGIGDDPSGKPLEEGDLWEDRGDRAGHESAPIRGGDEMIQGLFQTGFLSLSQGGKKADAGLAALDSVVAIV